MASDTTDHEEVHIGVQPSSKAEQLLASWNPWAWDYATRLATVGPVRPQVALRMKNFTYNVQVKEHLAANASPQTFSHALKNSWLKMTSLFKRNISTVPVLSDVTAQFLPGTMTLILCPPSSGSSTLLKALAGRLDAGQCTGELMIGPVSMEEAQQRARQQQAAARRTRWRCAGRSSTRAHEHDQVWADPTRLIGYVQQADKHFPTLTVKETLQFASDTFNVQSLPSDAQKMPDVTRGAVERVLHGLALESAADTIVGSDTMRGVSGGEYKRTTAGEMLVGTSACLCLDSVTAGLDSATAIDVTRTLRIVSKVTRKTIVAAFQQPTPEMYECFTHLLLLRDGQVMYHGRRDRVDDYLHSLGLRMPYDEDPADFLLDFLTSPISVYLEQASGSLASSRVTRASSSVGRGASGQLGAETQAPSGRPAAQPDDIVPGGLEFSAQAEDLVRQSHSRAMARRAAAGAAGAREASGANAENSPATLAEPLSEASFRRLLDSSKQLHAGSFRTAELKRHFEVYRALHPAEAGSVASSASITPASEPASDDLPSVAEEPAAPSLSGLHPAVLNADMLPNGQLRPLHGQALNDPARQDLQLRGDFEQHQFRGKYATGFCWQLRKNLERQVRVLFRDAGYMGGRLGNIVFISVLISFTYINLPPEQFNAALGLLFFGLLSIAFANFPEVIFAANAKQVVVKQRDAQFYAPSAYIFASVVVSAVIAFIETMIFVNLVFWITGLGGGFIGYLYFTGLVFLTGLTLASLFRVIVYVAPTLELAQSLLGPIVGITVIYAGLIIAPSQLPSWLIWAYWISPFSYVLRGLAISEFKSSKYDEPLQAGGPRQGDVYLDVLDIQDENIWKWIAYLYILGCLLVVTALSIYAMSRSSLGRPATRPTKLADYEEKELRQVQAGDSSELPAAASPSAARGAAGAVAGEEGHGGASSSSRSPARAGVVSASPSGAPARAPPARVSSGSREQSILSFPKVNMSWQNITYDVPVEGKQKRLLRDMHGYAQPGEVLALMGASGAGKTTLLDVLAQRKTQGTVNGEVYIESVPVQDAPLRRIFAYVEQSDLHMPYMTVRESVEFAAKMRLPASQREDAAVFKHFIDEILEVLELSGIQNHYVGGTPSADVAGISLSAGVRKRVSIAIELASNPSILFLDEPTTGLDSASAQTVLRVIGNVAKHGRAVICTIHQPSAAMFYCFDKLLLLAKGGRQVYFGDLGYHATAFVKYMESVPGTTPRPKQINPADWMLRVLQIESDRPDDHAQPSAPAAADEEARQHKYEEAYRSSELCAENGRQIEERQRHGMYSAEDAAKLPTEYTSKYAATRREQFHLLLTRAWTGLVRNRQYGLLRVRIELWLAVLFALTFIAVDESTQAGGVSLTAAVFISALFVAISAMTSVLPVLDELQRVVEHERGMYSRWLYALAEFLVELPAVIFGVLLFNSIFYWVVPFANRAFVGGFLLYNLGHILLTLNFLAIGHAALTLLGRAELAQILIGMTITVTSLYAGFYTPPSQIPSVLSWIVYVNPVYYGLEIMVTTAVKTASDKFPVIVDGGQIELTLEQFVSDVYDLDHGDVGFDIIILSAIFVGLVVAKVLAKQFVRHGKR